MNIPPMKVLLPAILLAALAAGLWQRSEMSTLAEREIFLREKLASSPSEALEERSAPVTKPGQRTRPACFNAPAFVEKFVALAARHEAGGDPPSDNELEHLMAVIVTASPRELMKLAEELRHDRVPPDLRKGLFTAIAPRVAENDPKLGAGLAVEGGEREEFLAVMRLWLSRDPKAMSGWLAEVMAADPTLGPAGIRRLDRRELDTLALTARLAADPAGDALQELFDLKSDSLPMAIEEMAASMPAADLTTLMKRIAQTSGLPEHDRLAMIGTTLAKHSDPVQARQVLLDAALPPEQFRKAATTMIVSLDPVGIRAGVEWFRTSTAGETKAEGLRGIVATWAGQDPEAAVAWVEGLSDAAEKADLQAVLPEPSRKR